MESRFTFIEHRQSRLSALLTRGSYPPPCTARKGAGRSRRPLNLPECLWQLLAEGAGERGTKEGADRSRRSSSANQRSSNSGVAGRLVTKAFEVCDNVVEEIFGLKGLEFEIVMSRVNTEDTAAHQRRRFDRRYFREWDRLEYLLERSLRIEAGSFVRQHKLTIMLDHTLAGFFVEPTFDVGFECLIRHKFLLSKCLDEFVVLLAHPVVQSRLGLAHPIDTLRLPEAIPGLLKISYGKDLSQVSTSLRTWSLAMP
jgi:hypothetical protein